MKTILESCINRTAIRRPFFLIVFTLLTTSCDEFLNPDLNKSLITEELVYSNDVTATSAVTGIYHEIQYFSPLSGTSTGLTALTSLSANELKNYTQSPEFLEFENHNISEVNPYIQSLWNFCYSVIYQANAILNGINKSTLITPEVAAQLNGEALFIRAFSYFYLVNLFGDVPLILETDYRVNATVSRTDKHQVYDQILADLQSAKELISNDYVTTERVRPNQATVHAMLARVFLHLGEWEKAEVESSSVIEDSRYALLDDLTKVFLKNSEESIWQLVPVSPSYNTLEGRYSIITSTPSYHVLNENFISDFDPNDKRLSWIGSFSNSIGTFYYPYKYKLRTKAVSEPLLEYSIIFRLAEQYLIRAESRARQNDLAGAILDLDNIRDRAGLSLIRDTEPNITQPDLLLRIESERKLELFTEWGHRWLDLKRTGRSLDVLDDDLTMDDLIYPIPKSEFDRNSQLGLQNPGY